MSAAKVTAKKFDQSAKQLEVQDIIQEKLIVYSVKGTWQVQSLQDGERTSSYSGWMQYDG
ncbi:MAG: hypothetical protein GY696_39945 [Gammaproteobacteria bacterium]|nr:hypothetical protein [Gammaproteobacteria bacterium]